ncbi:methylenetetrahydrofolate--tRNA-(uracil(54)-C(5))-methyltransferase (FADH(2)-oxidizing) TrmFO [Cloacibacillus porcorum]|uniref:Methylenetetrahydrofolate--tRNA-(uracil-5-)-methyltransferase TrmFO n=1 Tax=Cloacibacillus porcorum TaxID=1197717 RepID=A0A1B2I5G0_9BACT|nr:methylenetetrahydrofolate--tRNA-(uracil(54)-C(5))-methyltransferase (FADH(2)-oxidizing) TrmFO [Cloacibacillus porcorum]ANZ45208.1 methylenetetrahydrofolate--tRNA-(uracil(54)-C(5))-methyltransferase (FADH(2)-oxidizing) TrmFO [Cloacibacillus porcorum]
MTQTCKTVTVAGGGLAGSEAAWQLAERGVRVRLCEMRPLKMTPAHETPMLGELVCSNSLGGEKLTTPAGILKAELKRMDSLIMRCAEASRVPAGNALAVDREVFARLIDDSIASHPNIELVREELTEIPEEPAIIATGPLTSASMAQSLAALTGEDFLYFYDAVAPIVDVSTVDMSKAFRANRYGMEGDYINCPMNEEEYNLFWNELVNAETAPRHDFEEEQMRHFDGCLPVEVIAKRGEKTLLFGPLRPVGFEAFNDGKEPCAVVQLRQDNGEGSLFNIVGFQTNLKWGEQERVFRLIPALREAEFVRKGVMHRNLFVCAPKVLDPYLRFNGREALFIAGQASGVEGYMESTAMGLAAALFAYLQVSGLPMADFPLETAVGSLLNYLRGALPESFQPMNVNLGIFPRLPGKKIRRRTERCEAYAARSLEALEKFIGENKILFPNKQL